MNKINLLDCTLRDGGYINNWAFGLETIKNILTKLVTSGVEYIECGYLSEKRVEIQNQHSIRTLMQSEKLSQTAMRSSDLRL